MKKPKSLDTRNALHSAFNSSSAVDDDPASVIVDNDDDLKSNDVISSLANSRSVPITGGVTANLSRKKATPPNPSTKKVVIKLDKWWRRCSCGGSAVVEAVLCCNGSFATV
ncbi:hypothetical protein BVRB_6g143600 [Beta vulgaris subsp. vulgaris]|nr:hypothetical protein BVRB_6g143600 [Beta vulgaris subsp. vulgaris]